MSVIIKNVDKPQGCGGCFLIDELCGKWRERNWGAPPPDDCPIVQMPKFGTLLEAVELMYQEELQNEQSMENA